MEPSIKKTTPKDFFLQIGVIATLYFGVFSFLTLIFQIVDYKFPDKLQTYIDPYSGALRFAIASLIVMVPVHLVLMWLAERDYTKDPEKRTMPIRRWLIHLTIFAAGIAIIVDLITLINTFLGGEITTRFGLKVLAVLLVAGAIFWYYLADLRRKEGLAGKTVKIMMIAIVVVVIASLAGGFAVMGSPAKQRQLRFDTERTGHLAQIQWQIVSYWQQKEKLPIKLEELVDPITGFSVPFDPETNEPYEYQTVGTLSFKLCTTFGQPSPLSPRSYMEPSRIAPYDALGPEEQNWKHEAGRQCFTRTIDPERLPPADRSKR